MEREIALLALLAVFITIYILKMAGDLLSSPIVSTRFILAAMFWPVMTVWSLIQSLSGKRNKPEGGEELP